jgi:hypothetical protein
LGLCDHFPGFAPPFLTHLHSPRWKCCSPGGHSYFYNFSHTPNPIFGPDLSDKPQNDLPNYLLDPFLLECPTSFSKLIGIKVNSSSSPTNPAVPPKMGHLSHPAPLVTLDSVTMFSFELRGLVVWGITVVAPLLLPVQSVCIPPFSSPFCCQIS